MRTIYKEWKYPDCVIYTNENGDRLATVGLSLVALLDNHYMSIGFDIVKKGKTDA